MALAFLEAPGISACVFSGLVRLPEGRIFHPQCVVGNGGSGDCVAGLFLPAGEELARLFEDGLETVPLDRIGSLNVGEFEAGGAVTS